MWRILKFLSRYGNLLLFLFLELVALVLIINLNDHQQHAYQAVAHEVSGGLHKSNLRVKGYFNLSQENRKLQAQNIRLYKDLIRLRNELNTYKYRAPYTRAYTLLPDSLFPTEGFGFIPARTMNTTIHKNYNYITLDKGRKNGVGPGMGLLSSEGVAGMVISTSPNYSVAISVLNQNFKLSSRLLHQRDIGTLSWNGASPEYAILEFIPQTSPLEIGDTVVTSGYSTIFPEKFLIGVVSEFDEENHDGFYNIKVRLAADFRALDNLFIVKHDYQSEIDSLEQAAAAGGEE